MDESTLKPSILDLSLSELAERLGQLGQPRFRARQVWDWLYGQQADSFEDMTNLPAGLRAALAGRFRIRRLHLLCEQVSEDVLTHKALFLTDRRHLRRGDNPALNLNSVETVLMQYPHAVLGADERARRRATVCVSTQVGCAVGCPFCETGRSGLIRNLAAGEIVEQVLYFERWGRERGARPAGDDRFVTHVVFMGMGEPMHNYEASLRAVELLNDPRGLGLGARHMTISTSGLVPGILRLAEEPVQVGLAISLHAPNDELRNRLVPVNRRYPLAQLLDACRVYLRRTGRRLSFEYVLIDGVNDSVELARELVGLVQGMLCHVNLIPMNPTSGEFRRPPRQRVLAFQAELVRRGIPTTVRVEKGVEIQAACGQLRVRAAS